MDKRQVISGICILGILLFSVSCGRKEKAEEELTPFNAIEKYGDVMGTAMKRARVMDDVLNLRHKISTFQIQEGRYPVSLNELVEKRYIEKLPELPKGVSFIYDPLTGSISAQ